jgi:acyl-CoA reductase-like NAD-dependent aldehyde dehydrogenase
VVGIITPSNFPLAIPAWKIAPALAYGNCVVFKPADLVPGCAWALAEIISQAGGLLRQPQAREQVGPGGQLGESPTFALRSRSTAT